MMMSNGNPNEKPLTADDIMDGVIRLRAALADAGAVPTRIAVHPVTWPEFKRTLQEFCKVHEVDASLPPEMAVRCFTGLPIELDEEVPIGSIHVGRTVPPEEV